MDLVASLFLHFVKLSPSFSSTRTIPPFAHLFDNMLPRYLCISMLGLHILIGVTGIAAASWLARAGSRASSVEHSLVSRNASLKVICREELADIVRK